MSPTKDGEEMMKVFNMLLSDDDKKSGTILTSSNEDGTCYTIHHSEMQWDISFEQVTVAKSNNDFTVADFLKYKKTLHLSGILRNQYDSYMDYHVGIGAGGDMSQLK